MLNPEQYMNCVYFILNKYHMPVEEYFDVALIALYEACQEYDEEKAKNCTPQTFVCYGIERLLNNELRKEYRFFRHIYKEESKKNWCGNFQEEQSNKIKVEQFKNPEILFKSQTRNDIDFTLSEIGVQEFLGLLCEKDQLILKYRMRDYTLSEIAKLLNCTRQNISSRIKNIQRRAIYFFGKDSCCPDKRKHMKIFSMPGRCKYTRGLNSK